MTTPSRLHFKRRLGTAQLNFARRNRHAGATPMGNASCPWKTRAVGSARRIDNTAGFRPIAAALYVADFAGLADEAIHEVIHALDLPEATGVAAMDQPTTVSLQAAVSLGIDDRNWRAHLKLVELTRHGRTLPIVALRKSSSGNATSADASLDLVEDQLAEAMATGDDAV